MDFKKELSTNKPETMIRIEKNLIDMIMDDTINHITKFKILEDFSRITPYYLKRTVEWIYYTSIELYWKFFTRTNDDYTKVNCSYFLLRSELEASRKSQCINILREHATRNLNTMNLNSLSNIIDLLLQLGDQDTIEYTRDNLLQGLRRRETIPYDNNYPFAIKNTTVYDDSQNVHDKNINKCIMDRIIILMEDKDSDEKGILSLDSIDVINRIQTFLIDKGYTDPIIKESLDRITIDCAIFTHKKARLRDVLHRVWNRIMKMKNDQDEAIKRLVEELIDMNGLCSTGHVSRIVNILSDLEGGFSSVKISWKQQIESNIRARLTNKIKSRNNVDDILSYIVEDKNKYNQFLDSIKDSIYNELRTEFEGVFNKVLEDMDELTLIIFDKIFNAYWNKECLIS